MQDNSFKLPAGVSKDVITFIINDSCTGCMVCAKKCPDKAISGNKKEKHLINQSICTKCGTCYTVCKFKAITLEMPEDAKALFLKQGSLEKNDAEKRKEIAQVFASISMKIKE